MALGMIAGVAKTGLNLLTGGLLNKVFSGGQDARQLAQQKKLIEMQGAEWRANTAWQKDQDLDMWQKTSYPAQLAMMKEAGLSPGLMYGQGGGGGTTTGGSAPMTAGGQAANASQTMGDVMQLAMMKAQTENIQADTKLKQTAATKTEGADTANTIAETAVKKAQQRILEVQGDIANLTETAAIAKIKAEAQTSIEEATSAMAAATIDKATIQTKINTIAQEYTNLTIEAAAKKQGIAVDRAKITEITQGIQQRWRELEIKGQQSSYEHSDRVKAIEDYTTNALKVAGIMAVGNLASSIVQIATKQLPKGNTTLTNQYNKDGEFIKRIESMTKPNN